MVNDIFQFAVWFAWNCGAMPCNLKKERWITQSLHHTKQSKLNPLTSEELQFITVSYHSKENHTNSVQTVPISTCDCS